MPTDRRVAARSESWVAVLLVAATGTGVYLTSSGHQVAGADETFMDVAWWNIRDFSDSAQRSPNYATIAKCIKGCEIVAIGELNSPAALAKLVAKLGPSWRYTNTAGKVGRTPGSSEYYGFVWNSDAVESDGVVVSDSDPDDDFDRDPSFATFRTVDGHMDLSVMALHATWGKTVEGRKKELRALVGSRARALHAGADPDLIILGDFNRDIGDDAFEPLLSGPGMVRVNEDTVHTTVGTDHTYDQIFLSTDTTREWTGEFDCVPFDEMFFPNNEAKAIKQVSDHRPVSVRLVVPSADDD